MGLRGTKQKLRRELSTCCTEKLKWWPEEGGEVIEWRLAQLHKATRDRKRNDRGPANNPPMPLPADHHEEGADGQDAVPTDGRLYYDPARDDIHPSTKSSGPR